MEDSCIINLFCERSEQAIKELSLKYGRLCYSIAFNILYDSQEAEECENDTYLKVWNSIPPQRPEYLIAFVCKIARNLSLNRLRYNRQKKRSTEIDDLYSELNECIPSGEDFTQATEDEIIVKVINDFLRSLDDQTRVLFIRRYFYMETAEALSKRYKLSSSNVSTKLYRARVKLKSQFKMKGIII